MIIVIATKIKWLKLESYERGRFSHSIQVIRIVCSDEIEAMEDNQMRWLCFVTSE